MTRDLGPCWIVDASGRRAAKSVTWSAGRITEITPAIYIPQDAPILCPGLMDLQVNGGGGLMLGDATGPEDVSAILTAHRSLGTAAILPTLISDTPEVTARIIAAVSEAARQNPGILGLHLEGPHLARAGAHDPGNLRSMTDDDLALYLEAADTLPALMITLAPERASPAQISALAEAGVLVSLGHSDCSYEAAVAAYDAGARGATHLGNAMSGLHHRAPGLMGAALERAAFIGVIADGVHLHDAVLRLANRAAGPRLIAVSDAMAVAGTDEHSFRLQGRKIRRAEGKLCLPDGTLAGADISLLDAIRHFATATDQSLAEALPIGFERPAEVLGHPVSILEVGSSGPLTLLSQDGAFDLLLD
ncbi:MAG: N-acetylglucosamine-6-phosphate deacetylase [Pseudomonadota bacterium]